MKISGPKIFTPDFMLENQSIVIENGKIAAFSNSNDQATLNFPASYFLVPGFIDLHIHGSCGHDVMDGTFEALNQMSEALAKEGTTAFLATTMTASENKIEEALKNIAESQSKVNGAKMLGAHLEGPFLSEKKVGAQNQHYLQTPTLEKIQHWQQLSNHIIKLITLAPEITTPDFIHSLTNQNIVAAIGHTDATYKQTVAAIDAGCTHVTHLFNAMRGLHQREPGTVGAALLSDKVSIELIADGIHVHPAVIELAIRAKPKDKVVLVTDAMRAQCMGDGQYDLGGQSVTVEKGIASLSDGTLAGSTLTLSTAFKNILQQTSLSLQDAIQMTSENPAKVLNIFDRKGSIAIGKDADLVVLDDQLTVVMTICEGKIVFDRSSSLQPHESTKQCGIVL